MLSCLLQVVVVVGGVAWEDLPHLEMPPTVESWSDEDAVVDGKDTPMNSMHPLPPEDCGPTTPRGDTHSKSSFYSSNELLLWLFKQVATEASLIVEREGRSGRGVPMGATQLTVIYEMMHKDSMVMF
jgi:hypothetical protein